MKELKVIRDIQTDIYLVVCAEEISTEASDGSSTDYSLRNEESTCEYDLFKVIEKDFGIDTSSLYLAGPDNDIHSDEIDDVTLKEINKFAKQWLHENEWHDHALYWNYFDGSNWQSVLLHSEDHGIDDNIEVELLDEVKAQEFLNIYYRVREAPRNWTDGFASIKDKDSGLTVKFSQWAGEPSVCAIYQL